MHIFLPGPSFVLHPTNKPTLVFKIHSKTLSSGSRIYTPPDLNVLVRVFAAWMRFYNGAVFLISAAEHHCSNGARLSELSLHDVIDTAVGECRSLDSFANMAVEVSCDRGLRVEVDQQHLGEVFVNLLRNAAEACEGVGAIGISAHVTEESVVIEFVDSGPGVSVRMRDEIFKPFSTSKDYGNGIGLAFSRKVVEAHGGSIELFSGDSGACFRIKLPIHVVIATTGLIRV